MARSKRPRPIESFGPEILAALLKGATGRFEFPLSYNTAIRFRLRVHQLREAMRNAGHEKYELASRVRVSIIWPEDTPVTKIGQHNVPNDRSVKCRVVLQPNDSEFAAVLRGAGVDPLENILRAAKSLDNIGDEDASSTAELAKLLEDLDK